jgi:hypothetical protein
MGKIEKKSNTPHIADDFGVMNMAIARVRDVLQQLRV